MSCISLIISHMEPIFTGGYLYMLFSYEQAGSSLTCGVYWYLESNDTIWYTVNYHIGNTYL